MVAFGVFPAGRMFAACAMRGANLRMRGVLLVADGPHLAEQGPGGLEPELQRVAGRAVVRLHPAEQGKGEAGVRGEPV
jgi:hypothetical protein